jgi:predicted AlkP superfamily pyrophosphatase or phosphodiesterase
MVRHRCTVAVALAAVLVVAHRPVAAQRAAPGARTPKLIVLLVVDQMRGDYVDRYRHQWTRGLSRLLTQGAWFRQVDYPYFNTVTCPGHASISTGAVPQIHGLILNNWWDRTLAKPVTCTEDDRYPAVSYGKPVAGGESAARMQVPTFADELRIQRDPPGRTIAFSLKARSSITLSGRKPDAVAWFDDSGSWTTSSAFASGPVPAVADFIRRNPVENDLGRTWDLALDVDAYHYDDQIEGLRPAKGGMAASFPYVVKGETDAPDRMFYERWQSSPFADRYLVRMALSVARSLGYGTMPGPNMVAISFSSPDRVGHDYGPNSRQVQDTLIRLDETLGELFDGLDRLVGPGQYTVTLSADHGVGPIPEQSNREGLDGGRINVDDLKAAAEQSIAKALGTAARVTAFQHNYLYLEEGVFEKLRTSPLAMRAVLNDLARMPGVLRAYSRDELEEDRFGDDRMGHQAALSHVSERGGDLLLAWKPNWVEGSNSTNHGTGYRYDTHVPLLLMGTGIARGEYLQPASPTDIAPTLAFLADVTLPRVSGRVLIEALTPRSPAPSRRPGSVP